MPVGTTQFGQASLVRPYVLGTAQFGEAKTETHTEAPMTQHGRAAIIDHAWCVSFSAFCFLVKHIHGPARATYCKWPRNLGLFKKPTHGKKKKKENRPTQFEQADLSKMEAHTKAPMAPMTQLGRAAAPSSIIDHVCFVSFSVFSFS